MNARRDERTNRVSLARGRRRDMAESRGRPRAAPHLWSARRETNLPALLAIALTLAAGAAQKPS